MNARQKYAFFHRLFFASKFVLIKQFNNFVKANLFGRVCTYETRRTFIVLYMCTVYQNRMHLEFLEKICITLRLTILKYLIACQIMMTSQLFYDNNLPKKRHGKSLENILFHVLRHALTRAHLVTEFERHYQPP